MRTAYLNIGSNRGDSRALLADAIARIARALPRAFVRQSQVVQSAPWGYVSPNRYLNVGVALDFDNEADMPAPIDLLALLQGIERDMAPDSPHRNSDGTYRDRHIDIDIIDIDGVVMQTPRLTIPHPRAEARAFVMEPMQVLAPGWTPAAASGKALKKTIADMHRDTVTEFRAKPKIPVTMVLDNIRSLNNIGSIFRTSDAFCVSEVLLCGITATPPDAQIHKTALGAEDAVAWRHYDNTLQAISDLRVGGWTICCLEQVHGSIPLNSFTVKPGAKIAVIAGNEVTGVDPAVVAASDVYLEIPQAGTKHSLNVAVSSAIALWHLFVQIHTRSDNHSTLII